MDTQSQNVSARSVQFSHADDIGHRPSTPETPFGQRSSAYSITQEEHLPLLKHVASLCTPRQIQAATHHHLHVERHSNFGVKNMWENFKDIDYVSDQYPDLIAEEVSRAAAQLELVSLGVEGAAVCNTQFKNCIMYKQRPMRSSTLLHFAIWLSSETEHASGVFETLLEDLQEPDQVLLPAILPAGPNITFVSAVHIAAGLGLLDILETLTEYVCEKTSEEVRMTPSSYVNLWASNAPKDIINAGFDPVDATIMRKGERDSIKLTEVYQAIHESTYQGHADVTMWLLNQGADSCALNNVGITPLHFVAFSSISGTLESNSNSKLSRLVRRLVSSSDTLEATADMSKFLNGATSVTPFEVAVQTASKFPQDCVGLLAPCLANGAKLSYFDDICKIASATPRGALNLVETIAERGKRDPHTLKCFRLNAQQEGASDILASIFFTAPEAASEMLELLEIEPFVEDSAHYPVPAHVSLWGLFKELPMRCAYQNDVRKVGQMMIPSWEWRKYKEVPDKWHDSFMPKIRHNSRKSHIKSVRVVAYLLPGILDVDIMMSLARLRKENYTVLEKRSVEGAIFCLWENLVSVRWMANVSMVFYDLAALMTIAFFLHHVDHKGFQELALSAIIGQVVRSTLEFTSALANVVKKNREFKDDEIMCSMWSPFSGWFLGSFALPLFLTALNLVMLISVEFDVEGIKQGRHADTLLEKISFSGCLLMCCLQFVVMWRFATIGSTIYTVRTTISSGAVNQTLFIFGMLFMSFTLILLVWNRGDGSLLILAAFRGWLFADGDGFNDMGMRDGINTKVIFALFAAFFFNVMTLNIIIAVYGHEYDKAHEDRKFMFLKGRAHYCTGSILSSYIIPWMGTAVNRVLITSAFSMIGASVYLSLYFHNSIHAGVLLGLGERLLSISLMQCEWFSPEGVDSAAKQRFLWICYSEDWQKWLGGYGEEQHSGGKGLVELDEEHGVHVSEPREVSGMSGTSVNESPTRRGSYRSMERITQQFRQLQADLEKCTGGFKH